jgi:undecaprenyl diphosphate synthase
MFGKDKTEIKHAGIIVASDDDKKADREYFKLIDNLVRSQIRNDLRMLTLYIYEDIETGAATDYFKFMMDSNFAKDNKIKVSVVGKWYVLDADLVEAIKTIMSDTKDYDGYFLNFCINYEGQQELVDACKVIGIKIRAGKIDPETITKEDIKENLSTSGFLPPALIIKTGWKRKLRGFLLWDNINARIYFTERPFLDFSVKQFEKILSD